MINRAPIDGWTLVHLAAGYLAARLAVPRWLGLGGAVAYELIEQQAERSDWGRKLFGTRGPESWPNAVVDVLAFGIGQEIGAR